MEKWRILLETVHRILPLLARVHSTRLSTKLASMAGGRLLSLHAGRRAVKSCTKAVAFVQFFNFLVRLLFECGFYSRAACMQYSDYTKPVKAVRNRKNESET